MDKLSVPQAIVVEGKYDKIRLEAVVDALILTTDGFRIFKDREMQALLRRLAHSCGIVVLTDSDAAGFRIRARIGEIARGGSVIQVYIPDIFGKERRKTRPGKEGKLGVEGLDAALLRRALEQAGLLGEMPLPASQITRQDLYRLGLIGGQDSSALRRALLRRLELPQRLSTNTMLPLLCKMVSLAELDELVADIRIRL